LRLTLCLILYVSLSVRLLCLPSTLGFSLSSSYCLRFSLENLPLSLGLPLGLKLPLSPGLWLRLSRRRHLLLPLKLGM